MLQIGSLLGCVLAGVLIERLGRRFTMRLVASLSFLSGYLVITLADSAALIMLGTMQQHLAPLNKLIIVLFTLAPVMYKLIYFQRGCCRLAVF